MYRVDEESCTGCGACVELCPVGAITLVAGHAHIDQATCIDCEACVDACPEGAIVVAAAPDRVLTYPAGQTPAAGALRPAWQPRPVWPLVGATLIWAVRELLPEILAAWQASRAGALRPASSNTTTRDPAVPQRSRGARRHRWGRA